MNKIKLSLTLKAVISIVITEFVIMMVISRFSVLRDAPPLFIAFLDTLLLGVVIVWVINRAFHPLRNMIDRMEEIRKGRLDIRLDVHSGDEIGAIARQINRMVEGLEVSYRKTEESERFLTAITDGIDEEIMLIDKDFKILWANKKIKELTGVDRQAIAGEFCYKLTHYLDKPCKFPLHICPIEDVIKYNKTNAVLHKHFDKQGNMLYVEVIAYPLADENGQVSKFIHISRDVTERMTMVKELEQAKNKLEEYSRKLEDMVEERTMKLTRNLVELADTNDELKTLQSQLIQAGKMAAIGQLATALTNEINNPLAVITKNVGAIKSLMEKKEGIGIKDAKDPVKMIEDSVSKCKKITQDLLGFSYISKGRFEWVSINEAIKKVLVLIEYERGAGHIAVVKHLQPEIPRIMGDVHSLQQVFMNIIVNAFWAIEQRSDKQDGKIVIKSQYKKDEDAICVYISDDGIGIAKEYLNRIFELFFTTKERATAAGLGLSIVAHIIKEHNGSVAVESEVLKGTTFKITFPVPSDNNMADE
ncbi:MAG: ATP-binding protein [Candidatus Omnitrophota bacterium]